MSHYTSAEPDAPRGMVHEIVKTEITHEAMETQVCAVSCSVGIALLNLKLGVPRSSSRHVCSERHC